MDQLHLSQPCIKGLHTRTSCISLSHVLLAYLQPFLQRSHTGSLPHQNYCMFELFNKWNMDLDVPFYQPHRSILCQASAIFCTTELVLLSSIDSSCSSHMFTYALKACGEHTTFCENDSSMRKNQNDVQSDLHGFILFTLISAGSFTCLASLKEQLYVQKLLSYTIILEALSWVVLVSTGISVVWQ